MLKFSTWWCVFLALAVVGNHVWGQVAPPPTRQQATEPQVGEKPLAERPVERDPFASVSLQDVSPREQAIRAALEKPYAEEFIEIPLATVVEKIGQAYNINVQIDTRALDGVGIGSDTPITRQLKEISLRSALKLILKELELTWVIHDESLIITTPDEASSHLTTHLYPVEDLVASEKTNNLVYRPGVIDVSVMTDVITSTVAPDSWDLVGGPGAIQELVLPWSGYYLAVSQTEEVHRDVGMLLRRLRTLAPAPVAAAPPDTKKLVIYRLSPNAAKDSEKLVLVIKRMIEPGSWTLGGNVIDSAAGVLVVNQSIAVQQQVAKLLEGMNVLAPNFDYYAPPVVGQRASERGQATR